MFPLTYLAQAQNARKTPVSVSGVVTERASGQALAGVSIKVKGGEGVPQLMRMVLLHCRFRQVGSLVFSYVGFNDREVSVNNQRTINIELERGTSSLNEVVVVGYGTQTKRDVTGSVASVGAKQLQDRAVVSFSEALAGQVAGYRCSRHQGRQVGEYR